VTLIKLNQCSNLGFVIGLDLLIHSVRLLNVSILIIVTIF